MWGVEAISTVTYEHLLTAEALLWNPHMFLQDILPYSVSDWLDFKVTFSMPDQSVDSYISSGNVCLQQFFSCSFVGTHNFFGLS